MKLNLARLRTIFLLKLNLNKVILCLMTLDEVALEVPVKVVKLAARNASEQARLSGLGLRAGTTITKVMPTPLRDPVACLVGPQLLALERRLLASIHVEKT